MKPSPVVTFFCWVSLALLALLFAGCTPLMSKEPKTESVTMPGSPAEVYPRALQAFARMGGRVSTAHAPDLVSGEVHNAVVLTITLATVSDGTRVEVVGTLLPNKIVVGAFDEVAEYLVLLRAL